MQDVNLVFRDLEKNSVLIPPEAMKSLTDFPIEERSLRRQRTALGEYL